MQHFTSVNAALAFTIAKRCVNEAPIVHRRAHKYTGGELQNIDISVSAEPDAEHFFLDRPAARNNLDCRRTPVRLQ
ncbi:MAG TPA: hypothetical protein VGJ20_28035 [Xanthobacteraceae bacterium]|jgi:translation initiation factor RLI1